MKKFGVLARGVSATLALGGPSLVGRAEQNAAPAAPAGVFDTLHFRPIGPASMSGRISDLAVYEADPNNYEPVTGVSGSPRTSGTSAR